MQIQGLVGLQQQRVGSLLAAANTPQATLEKVLPTGDYGPALNGWRLYDPCTAQTVDGFSAPGPGLIVQGHPFVIQVDDECTTLSRDLDLKARALDLLGRVQSAAIARELWGGALSIAAAAVATGVVQEAWQANPILTKSSGLTTLTTSAVSPIEGVALIEQALGEQLAGSPGMLHGSRRAITHLVTPASLTRNGDVLQTALGTKVVADAGYPGTAPGDVAPATNKAWLYGTAVPTIITGTPDVPGDASTWIDRSTNRSKVRAEVPALILLPPVRVAAQITLPTT